MGGATERRPASATNVGVVIAAAGRGLRALDERHDPAASELKQFRLIAGTPMMLWAVRPFARHPLVREIVAVLPPSAAADPPDWLRAVEGRSVAAVPGGATRAHSVYLGVRALSPACTSVVVHDGARPFVRPDVIECVLRHVATGTSAVAAVPVSDTLKRADETGRWITTTVDRTGLWRAHTPQGFPRAALEEAYRRTNWDAAEGPGPTDEAALVEAAGFPVALVRDSALNLKVTTPEDFDAAERLAPA